MWLELERKSGNFERRTRSAPAGGSREVVSATGRMEAAPPERRGAGGEVEEEEAEEDGGKKRGGGFGQWKDQAELPPALRPSTDVITRVFSQLDCVDLLHCSLVCKSSISVYSPMTKNIDVTAFRGLNTQSAFQETIGQWYRDSAELREGWKNEYLEALKFYGMGIKRETHPPSSTFYKRCA